MSLEEAASQVAFTPLDGVFLALKIGILILAVLHFVFSLIVVRQVALMTETLMTEVTPLLRAFSIIYSGVALGIIVLFIGLLFG